MTREKREEAVIIGKKLKEMRLKAGLTQLQIAQIVGITDAGWRGYELGARIPNDKVKKLIAVHFNKTIDEIFY